MTSNDESPATGSQRDHGQMNRRTVLKASAAVGLVPTFPWSIRRPGGTTMASLPPVPVDGASVFRKYVNPLPNPLAEGFRMVPNNSGRVYDVSMVHTTHEFHSDPTAPAEMWSNVTAPVFAYLDNTDDSAAFGNGTFPGKTFVVESDESVTVTYRNELFDGLGGFLPVDRTVHGASEADNSKVRTVTHLHGGITQPPSDGEPEDTRTPGKPQVMHYSNRNPASTLWYHDHALGITRLNVYAGLAGFYIVRDDDERELVDANQLPGGDYEIPIVLQDRLFTTSADPTGADATLCYPFEGEDVDGVAIGSATDPRVPLEFFGDTAVVNGKVWPVADVAGRKYRFRLLNGSNSRFYNLRLVTVSNVEGSYVPDFGATVPAMWQIGTDGGFLPEAVEVNQASTETRLLLAPGERADVVVDFNSFAGESFVLFNNAGSPFKGGNFLPDSFVAGDDALSELMCFRVGTNVDDGVATPANVTLPVSFPALDALDEADAVNTRHLTLVEGTEAVPATDGQAGVDERLQPRLGVVPTNLDPGYRDIADFEAEGNQYDDPTTEDPIVNQAEVWEVYNLTEDTHPIHLHIVQFRVLDRQSLDIREQNETRQVRIGEDGLPATTGEPSDPDPNETGPKDTVRADPGEVTRILVPFDTFPGETVWHCHILEHEDNEMMRPMRVGGKPKKR